MNALSLRVCICDFACIKRALCKHASPAAMNRLLILFLETPPPVVSPTATDENRVITPKLNRAVLNYGPGTILLIIIYGTGKPYATARAEDAGCLSAR